MAINRSIFCIISRLDLNRICRSNEPKLKEKAASLSFFLFLQVEMSNRSSTQKENGMTTYELELDHLKKKVSMMVQLKGLDPDLAIAYEELSKDMLLLPEWDWQRR